MRESIGSTYIFAICLTFIILFTAYLAISVNYAKAFRMKSHIVSIIEEKKGFDDNLDSDIENYLISEGYVAHGKCAKIENTDWELKHGDNDRESDICIYRLTVKSDNDKISNCKDYYKVVVFFKFELPIINNLMTFRVSGDTKVINNFGTC